MNKRFDTALSALSKPISDPLYRLPPEIKGKICEIRLRVNRPVCLHTNQNLLFLRRDGTVTEHLTSSVLHAAKSDLQESFRCLCGYSVYAHQNEIRNGFVTYLGGHRVGVCGTAVSSDGAVTAIREITSMNVRIARESRGIADPVLHGLGDSLEDGLLILGRPGSGKTTVLRDLCRQLASGALGWVKNVALIDERGEVAGVVQGEVQNDVGLCCDVFDGYPKGEGILQALRCFTPQFILCDELGSAEDAAAIRAGVHAGVSMITTLHADSLEDLQKRPQGKLLLETGAFRFAAILDSRRTFGSVREIYDLQNLYD